MGINQLFTHKPPIETVKEICLFYGVDLNNLEKKNTFTKNELNEHNLKDNYLKIINLLDIYYLECKKEIYFKNMDNKKCITILRQILRLYNYSIKSTEKYCNSKKFIMYFIVYNKPKSSEAIDGVINFD
jgi:hypothetical protein